MGIEGRYRITKKVADGGMAEIFLASQTGAQGFERPVIVKRILPAFSADPHFRNMFLDEAHIAMGLAHSNIVQVLDLGEVEGRYFLVLELVDGWDLAAVLARAKAASWPLPAGLALYIATEICRALAYAHGRIHDGKPLGIIHRDISPQNVLLSEHGEVKLTDFGIAKAKNKRERTQTGVIKGKLDFMSPEQARGAAIDARSDIFSVGTLLYLMVTGHRPFGEGTDLETLASIQNARFPPPEKKAPRIDAAIASAIKKAMAKDPKDRHPNAETIMVELETVARAAFPTAGQSQLKGWLTDLARRDRFPTVSRAPGVPRSEADAPVELTGKPIAARNVVHGSLALAETRLREADDATPVTPLRAGAGEQLATGQARRVIRIFGQTLGPLLVLGAIGGGATFLFAPSIVQEWVESGRRRLGGPAETKGRPDVAPKVEKEKTLTLGATNAPDFVPEEVDQTADDQSPTAVTVRLDSLPRGAKIRTKTGGLLGTTPYAVSLRSGTSHQLSFSKPGYQTVTRTIAVSARTKTVKVELSRARGRQGRR